MVVVPGTSMEAATIKTRTTDPVAGPLAPRESSVDARGLGADHHRHRGGGKQKLMMELNYCLHYI